VKLCKQKLCGNKQKQFLSFYATKTVGLTTKKHTWRFSVCYVDGYLHSCLLYRFAGKISLWDWLVDAHCVTPNKRLAHKDAPDGVRLCHITVEAETRVHI